MRFKIFKTTLLLYTSGLFMVHVNCQDPYVTFKGQVLQNHSYVELSEVGTSVEDGVQCHTDLTTCCNASYGPHGGQWYRWYYSSSELSQETTLGQGLVALHNSQNELQSGIYRCQIDTNASIHSDGFRDTVFVGLLRHGDSLNIRVRRSVFVAYPGQIVRVRCNVTLIGTLMGIPTFTWHGPEPLPTPVVTSLNSQMVTSDLIFNSINSSHEGRYTCSAMMEGLPFSVNDSTTVYVSEQNLSAYLRVDVYNTHPLQFTLTCTFGGGVATYVTWMKDSQEVDGGVTVLDQESFRYKHILNATEEGMYNCTISNDRPDTATSATLNVKVPAPPSNLSVSQNGLNSLLVSWMPSDGATDYIIYYKEINRGRELSSKTLSAGANDTNITISLNIRLTYRDIIHYVSIVAINRLTSREIIGYRGTRYSPITLRSPLAGPVNITLDTLTIEVTDFGYTPVVGRRFELHCLVDLHGTLSGNLTFSWQGPGQFPTPETPFFDNERSILIFNPLRLSHEGEYTCSARLENFPYTAQYTYYLQPNYLIPRPRTSVLTSHPPPFYAGTALNLTCNIPLSDAVDVPVVEGIRWVIDDVVIDSPVSSDRVLFLERNIVFLPVNISDNVAYQCDVHFEANADFVNYGNTELYLNVEAPPAPEVNIIATPVAVAGTAPTVECSVSVVPHLIIAPLVELSGPGEEVIASDTGLSLTHTLDTVLASNAGQQYVCKAVLEIESLGVRLMSQSAPYSLTVQIPRPTVIISSNTPTTLITGSSVTLTCVATIDPHVDVLGQVVISWGGPRPVRGIESGFGLTYTSNLTISDVGREDDGEYTCTVRVVGGVRVLGATVTKSISISVLDPNPLVIVSANPSNVLNIDGSATLTCEAVFNIQVNSLLSISFLWSGPGSEESTGTESDDGMRYTSDLVLSNVEKEDEGEYSCIVRVSGDANINITKSISVTVLAPEVEITAGSIAVVGTSLTLECAVSAVPHFIAPRVELSGPGEVLANERSLSLSHTLDPVLASDGAPYVCRAVLEIEGWDVPLISESSVHTLIVQIPLPMMKISANPSANVKIGSSVTLYCEATLDSGVDAAVSVSLTWGGPRVINSNESATERDHGSRYTTNLTISDIKKEDEGEYMCTVRVSGERYILGTNATESVTVSVSVPKPTVVISANPSGVLNVDSSLTLICTATFQSQVDVQSISIMWGGPRVVNGSDELYSVTEMNVGVKYTSNLTISNVMKSDEGEYTCTVLVNEGTDVISDSIQVNVLETERSTKKSSSAVVNISFLTFVMTGVLTISFS